MNSSRGPRFCHLCGAPLSGRFYHYPHGLAVCAACHAQRPRCARCRAPLADHEQRSAATVASTQGGDATFCSHCLRTAPRCACCGGLITQSWYTFDELLPPATMRRFCEPCVTHRPRCDICHAPVPANATSLADGQFRCALCASEMVLGDAGVRGVFEQAIALAERVAHVRPHQIPRLAIVGRREMGDVRRRFASEIPAGTGSHHVLGFFVREDGTSSIYVEMGMPRALLLGTLAHELAHAWQVELAPDLLDPLHREGFAEWVAHRVLVAGGHRRVAARATRRDDVYGRGLRAFLNVERVHGTRTLLEVARGKRPLMTSAR